MSTDGTSNNPTPRPAIDPFRGTAAPHDGFPRQRELAQKAIDRKKAEKLAKEGELQFGRTDGIWTNADGTPAEIAKMTDARLYDLVCWCVNERQTLFQKYGGDARHFLTEPLWLREQPLFLSLVITAAKRKITLPPTVFQFIERFVVKFLENIKGVDDEIDLSPDVPREHDPELLEQQQDVIERMSRFTVKDHYAQHLRRLDLD